MLNSLSQSLVLNSLAKDIFISQSLINQALPKVSQTWLPLISQSSADSAEQPVTTLLADLINSYEEHKKTSKYQEEVRRSAEHQASQKRVSRQIWWAQYNYAQGRKLSDNVRDGVVDFFELDWKQQQLVEDFDIRRAARALDQLLEQKRPPYRGAGSEVTTYER